MVVSKTEFNAALQEINESYAKLIARIEELEKAVAENSTKSTRTKATK